MSGEAVQGTIVHGGNRDQTARSPRRASPASCRHRRRPHQLHLILIAGVLLALLPRFAAGASSCGMGWVSHFCRGGNKRSMEDGALTTEDSNNDVRQKARSILLELLRQAKQHPRQQQQPQDDPTDGSGGRWPSAGSVTDDELPSAVDEDYLSIPRVDDSRVDREVSRRIGNTRRTQISTHDDRQDSDATGGTETLQARRSRLWSGRRSDVDDASAADERSKTTSELDKMIDGLLRRRLAATGGASEGGSRRDAAADGGTVKDEDVGMELDSVHGRPKDELMDKVGPHRAGDAADDGSVSSRQIRPSTANDGGSSSWRTWFGR